MAARTAEFKSLVRFKFLSGNRGGRTHAEAFHGLSEAEDRPQHLARLVSSSNSRDYRGAPYPGLISFGDPGKHRSGVAEKTSQFVRFSTTIVFTGC